jgi:hypothetical protein
MPYSDPIAAKLYDRWRATLPQERERKRLAMARLRQQRKERGEREPESTPAPIRRLQQAIRQWSH